MIFCGLLITLRERTWYSLSHRDRAARGGGRRPTLQAGVFDRLYAYAPTLPSTTDGSPTSPMMQLRSSQCRCREM